MLQVVGRAVAAGAAVLLVVAATTAAPTSGQSATAAPGGSSLTRRAASRPRQPDFDLLRRQQAETDRIWRVASDGYMEVEKIIYRSRVGDLEIPAFIFKPLQANGPKSHPALVWVHENIRGHLYEHYIPYIRQATAKGYVVIAPEYRGSIGYSERLYDAIDYGGTEVDDVVSAVTALASRVAIVDPKRVGIIGWSHGGMITLLAVFRNPGTFAAAMAVVPVANLFQRLAYKGVEEHRALIDPNNRMGGTPAEQPGVYRDRSPLFQVDKLRIPLRVHIADNDQDVNIEEGMQLVDALRSRQPTLSETQIFQNPPGGHLFDRRVRPSSWEPENTAAQLESWRNVWTFLDRTLSPPTPAAQVTEAMR
jgi:dipeptidyl aminopeptidase/acylaminoacyl peptidase